MTINRFVLGARPTVQQQEPQGQGQTPFLSYIDVKHVNFLPLRLTVGEAHDLGPWYTCSDELALVLDESAKRVS